MIQKTEYESASTKLTEHGLISNNWWHREDNRIVCDLCPRQCHLKPGDRGFCFVRQNVDDQMVLTTYGRSTGFCIDPIEKKPLNHFYPGTSVLSFGTAGCNLGCKFCQNWDISKSREIERLSALAMPEAIAAAAKELGCRSVAYTYNDPVIWAEYALDTAVACKAMGIKSVAVTAGFLTNEARAPFFAGMDAANVDLKAFSEQFYKKLTLSDLQPVLDTLVYLKHETDVWFEITNLVIPQANDSDDEFERMCDWILENVGDDVPLHFTAFHPDYRMRDRGPTPPETLMRAREIALAKGLKFVYSGNVHDVRTQSTYCPSCGELLIERDWYVLGQYRLKGNRCGLCDAKIPGHFDDSPGDWGARRLPVDMRPYAERFPAVIQPAAKSGESPRSTEGEIVGNPSAESGVATAERSEQTAMNAPQPIPLSSQQESALLTASVEHLLAAVEGRETKLCDPDIAGIADVPVAGVFVSLKRSGQLRSCCGMFGAPMTLGEALRRAAFRTATSDPRFPPVALGELAHLDQEVWLLFATEQVQATGDARIAAVEVGRHGLQIIRGEKRGLLLPGVPVDHGWDAETFLSQTCVKAGLPPQAWRDDETILLRFEGRVARSPVAEAGVLLPESGAVKRSLYSDEQFSRVVGFCHDTITALVRGATPQYYCSDVPDADVNAIALQVVLDSSSPAPSLWQVATKKPIPLQSTLFSFCEQFSKSSLRERLTSGRFSVDLAVARNPVPHGTTAHPDLRGFNPESQGLFVLEGQYGGWVVHAARQPEDLLKDVQRMSRVGSSDAAQVYAMSVQTNQNPFRVAAPKPIGFNPLSGIRPPAVAGKFYPADPAEMSAALDELLGNSVSRAQFAAAMVPHAGWIYSGRIAADVLKQIEFPKTVIVIGPKHTPLGENLAIMPHRTWQLPGGELASDFELAQQIGREIPEFRLDAEAHRLEHGIEVELPLIARLAPQTRVVGITIGRASLEDCDRFAEGLARVLATQKERPLLLISSDMNHFANDQENRRLDALALAELDRKDPDALFQTVRKNEISMCGVLPAVIVLKTLQKLELLHEAERVGYGTSADTTGDTSRVVGYAGMLFR